MHNQWNLNELLHITLPYVFWITGVLYEFTNFNLNSHFKNPSCFSVQFLRHMPSICKAALQAITLRVWTHLASRRQASKPFVASRAGICHWPLACWRYLSLYLEQICLCFVRDVFYDWCRKVHSIKQFQNIEHFIIIIIYFRFILRLHP